MGRAIADYWKTKKADRLRVFSPMFEEDEIPLTTLFRKYKAMPEIERKALDMATLQEKGIDVTAIDISPLSVETMKERGVKSFQMQYKDTIGEPFDWLYIDADTLKENAAKNGYIAEIVAEGEHYDYLNMVFLFYWKQSGTRFCLIQERVTCIYETQSNWA